MTQPQITFPLPGTRDPQTGVLSPPQPALGPTALVPPGFPLYSSAHEFFVNVLAALFAQHERSTMLWCEEWYRHPIALLTVEELWIEYESRYPAPGGLGSWLRDMAYPLMRPLMDPDGTFKGCMVNGKGHNPKAVALSHRASQ